MRNTIRLITNESGDWEVLLLNEKVYDEGHSIPTYTWADLIRDLGHEVIEEEVTDEEMENGLFEDKEEEE